MWSRSRLSRCQLQQGLSLPLFSSSSKLSYSLPYTYLSSSSKYSPYSAVLPLLNISNRTTIHNNQFNRKVFSTNAPLQPKEAEGVNVKDGTDDAIDRINKLRRLNAHTNVRIKRIIGEEDKSSHEVFKYELDFISRCKNVFYTQEGGYQHIKKSDLEKYFPYGPSGEVPEEFEHKEIASWMIRHPTKIVLKLLEEHEAAVNGTTANHEAGLRYPVNLPGLTDLTLWPGSNVEAYSYNNTNLIKNPDPTHNDMKVVMGKGSVQDSLIEELRKRRDVLPKKVMLVGDRGNGKSVILNQTVYHARKRGWIVFFVKSGWKQMNWGAFIEPCRDIIEGYDQELYSNPFMSAELLREFWAAHSSDLKDIPIQFPQDLEKYSKGLNELKEFYVRNAATYKKQFIEMREEFYTIHDTFEEEDEKDRPILNNLAHFNMATFELKTLNDLVLLGLANRDFSGLVVIDLVNELRNLNIPNKPVLFAVDEFNYFDMDSTFQYEGKIMNADTLCVPYAFKFLAPQKAKHEGWTVKNGMCIAANSSKYKMRKLTDYDTYRASVPLTIKVPTYSHVEFLAMVKCYQAHFIMDSVDNNEFHAFRMHVSNNPRWARKECLTFFLHQSGAVAGAVYKDILDNGGLVPPDRVPDKSILNEFSIQQAAGQEIEDSRILKSESYLVVQTTQAEDTLDKLGRPSAAAWQDVDKELEVSMDEEVAGDPLNEAASVEEFVRNVLNKYEEQDLYEFASDVFLKDADLVPPGEHDDEDEQFQDLAKQRKKN